MKKFAIYKSDTGYYFYRYYDSIEQLKGTSLEPIVTQDKLPVVADGKGGFFAFDEKDHNFSKLIESKSDYPIPLEKMHFKNHDGFMLGWMAPNGDTYSCSYTGHTKAAAAICRKFFPQATLPESTLGGAGWLKIIDSWNGTERRHGQYVYSSIGKITRAQADKLFDLGIYGNDEVQKLIKESENDW